HTVTIEAKRERLVCRTVVSPGGDAQNPYRKRAHPGLHGIRGAKGGHGKIVRERHMPRLPIELEGIIGTSNPNPRRLALKLPLCAMHAATALRDARLRCDRNRICALVGDFGWKLVGTVGIHL